MARKILLADDSVTAQNMGRKILADAGYDVVTVNNGSAALKKIAELKPDLVILDVYMPGYSGLEVCQRMKETPDAARIPVLLSVGKLEPFKPEEAQRVRADSYIVKPFEASELLSALSKLEDKVVPRPEPSKPGRFARAIAAISEPENNARDAKTSEENGWKGRIAFPPTKTGPEENEADDSAIYNPMNRDLRTVVETPAEKVEKAADLQEKALQEKKLDEGKEGDGRENQRQQHERLQDNRLEDNRLEGELPANDGLPSRPVVQDSEKPAASEAIVDLAALIPEGLPTDVTAEEVAAIAAASAHLQIAVAAAKEKAQDQDQNQNELRREPVAVTAAEDEPAEMPVVRDETPVEILSAVIPVEDASTASASPSSDQEIAQTNGEAVAENPIAGNSAVESLSAEVKEEVSSVAEPPPFSLNRAPEFFTEPLAVSLVESDVAQPTHADASIVELSVSESTTTESTPADFPTPATMVGAEPDGGLAARWSAVAVALPADEAKISLEQEMQKAHAAFMREQMSSDPAEVKQETSEQIVEQTVEPRAEQSVSAAAELPAEATVATNDIAAEFLPEPQPEPSPSIELASELVSPGVGEPVTELPQPEFAPAAALATLEVTSEAIDPISPAEFASAVPDAEAANADAAPVSTLATALPESEQAPKPLKESEVVKSTAAAWASWRQIRDAGEPKVAAAENKAEYQPAAMAVAAGAEQPPPEPVQSTDMLTDVANIVDSVLADLRPKLMAEISRKMSGKK